MIDSHIHYLRPEWADALWGAETRRVSSLWLRIYLRMIMLADPDVMIAALDTRAVDHAYISPELSIAPGPQIAGGPAAALALTRAMNDETMRRVAQHPDRLTGLAVVNPLGGEADLAELRRAIVVLGLRGVVVGATYRGESIDSAAARPFLSLVEALDVPLIMHPTAEGVLAMPRDYGLDLLLGIPTDLTLAAIRLLVSGRLTEFPRLRVVLPHLGGGLLALLGWLDATSAPDGPRPGIRAQRLYVDTATATPEMLRLAISTLGADHVLFGSDWPLTATAQPGDPLSDPAAMLEALELEPDAMGKILGGNARLLFG